MRKVTGSVEVCTLQSTSFSSIWIKLKLLGSNWEATDGIVCGLRRFDVLSGFNCNLKGGYWMYSFLWGFESDNKVFTSTRMLRLPGKVFDFIMFNLYRNTSSRWCFSLHRLCSSSRICFASSVLLNSIDSSDSLHYRRTFFTVNLIGFVAV